MQNLKFFNRSLLFIFLVIILTLSFYKNTFKIVQKEYFDNFQHDSEALILSKIFVDKNNIHLENNLGYIAIKGDALNFELPYYILNNNYKKDVNIDILKITDTNWKNGWSILSPMVVIKNDDSINLNSYLGHLVYYDKKILGRLVKIEKDENYLHVFFKLETSIKDTTLVTDIKTFTISGAPINIDNLDTVTYQSQIGLHGLIYSFLYNKFGISIDKLYLLNSVILAILIVVLVFQFSKIINIEFAAIFYLSIFFSPLFISFGRNLYWVPFLWILPIVLSYGFFLTKTFNIKIFLSIVIIFAFFVKNACGYEYISSIMLFSLFPYIYSLFTIKKRSNYINYSKITQQIFIIGLLAVIGFILALLFHAYIRGDGSFIDGLNLIYQLDIKRRTYGDPSVFGSALKNSLEASTYSVIKMYFIDWKTELLTHIDGHFFKTLVIFSLITIIYKIIIKHTNALRDLGIFIGFIIVPLSWYILAKSHSYEHPHINFILWYFGFIAAILYISYNGFRLFLSIFIKYILKCDENKF